MGKNSKILPIIVLLVFIMALIGIFISGIESKPSVLEERFLNVGIGNEITLKKMFTKNDFLLIVFFKADGFDNKTPLDNLLEFKSMDIEGDYRIVMIGIDGNYDSYFQFLLGNSKYFLSFTWLYTNNTNYFRYLEEPDKLNIYVFWMEGDNVKSRYLGSDLSSDNIRRGIESLGVIE